MEKKKTIDLETLNIKRIVATQLRAARTLRNLTVREAAKKLGISASFLSQMENEDRNISLELLFKASSTYKVSIDALLGRENIPGDNVGKKVLNYIAPFFSQSQKSTA